MNRGQFCMITILALSVCCHGQDPGSAAAAEASPLTSPSSESSSALAVPLNSYVIGASDLLKVTVWKEANLSGELLVRPDGMISMPLLGDVHAAGLTPLQLGSDIEGRLKRFIQSPNVTVVISQIHSKVVYL